MTVQTLYDRVLYLRDHCALTDRQILGSLVQPKDAGEEWVEGANNYVWWRAVGETFKPKSVVEIGTRFGYSLTSLLSTCVTMRTRIAVVDDERDADVEPLRVFEHHFRVNMLVSDVTILRADSQKLSELPFTGSFDLGSVDADHTADGCHHDCGLVWDVLRPGGLMVVDDCQPGGVRDGCERFCRERGVDFAYLPSLRGVHLVLKPE